MQVMNVPGISISLLEENITRTGRVPRGAREAHSGRPEMQPTVRIETLSGFKKKKGVFQSGLSV